MAYNRTNFQKYQVLTAEHLNKIEDALVGLGNIDSNAKGAFQILFIMGLDDDLEVSSNKSYEEIAAAIEEGKAIESYLMYGANAEKIMIKLDCKLYSSIAGRQGIAFFGDIPLFNVGMGIIITMDPSDEIVVQELPVLEWQGLNNYEFVLSDGTRYTLNDAMDINTTINIPVIDANLNKNGYAADAKKVGDKINALTADIKTINEEIDGLSGALSGDFATKEELTLLATNNSTEHTSIRSQIANNTTAINVLTNGTDPNVIDGVNDLINYVNSHGSATTQMQSDIKELKDALNIYEISSESIDITTLVSLLPSGTKVRKGDVMIVTNSLGVKTAYQYDGTWVACDGNVDATAVIMPYDITLAGSYTQVGNLSKTSTGTATFATKGKSVATVLKEMLSKREQPKITSYPTIIFNSITSGAYEVGTPITPSWNVSLSAGSYTYGPPTGITATSWNIRTTDGSGRASTAANGSFPQITVLDNTNYSIAATATYDNGTIAYDNLGDASNPTVRIAGDSKTKTSDPITGYRSWFMYVGTDNTTTIDSNFIRSNATNMGDGTYAATQNSVTIPAGTKRVIIALPQQYGKTLSQVIDIDGMGLDVIGNFTKTICLVMGYNNYNASAMYDLWVAENANGLAATKYNFIIN